MLFAGGATQLAAGTAEPEGCPALASLGAHGLYSSAQTVAIQAYRRVETQDSIGDMGGTVSGVGSKRNMADGAPAFVAQVGSLGVATVEWGAAPWI